MARTAGRPSPSGALDLIDLYHINAALLGQATPGMNILAIKKIGPEGGKLIADGFMLTIPAGAFTEAVELTLYQSTLDTPFGAQSDSPCFHVSGLPQTFNLPLQVKIPATAATSDATVLGVGTIGYVPSEAAFRRGFRPFEPSAVSGEWFTFEIPTAPAGGGAEGLAQAGGGTLAAGGLPAFTLEIVDTWFNLGTRQVIMHGPHFDITFPVALSAVEVGYLLEAFETAYDTLKDPSDYGFSYTGAPAGKIPVVVKDLGPDRYGAYFNPPGTAFDCIEINIKDVSASARSTYQATACHEFFHLVQALYKPGVYIYYSLPYRSLWLDEACSVWSEQITVPGQIPTVFDSNVTESFRGLIAGAAGKEQDHGYGMAALIKYFVDRRVVDKFPLKVYQQLKANKSTVEVIQSAGGQTDFLWWTEYLESLILGELYGLCIGEKQRRPGLSVGRCNRGAAPRSGDLHPFQVTVDSVTVPSRGSGSNSFEIWSTTGIKYYLFDGCLWPAWGLRHRGELEKRGPTEPYPPLGAAQCDAAVSKVMV